ncbi:MAG TPA: diguanylate cyclase [Burkholderiales bacterium]|nr:diguanylate cyclase [Burkholderiales bacterium]
MATPDDAKPDLIAGLQQLPMRHRWLRWAVLAASLAFSAASAYYFSVQVRHEAHSRFETVAIGIANDVQSRIRAYGDVLYALRGLFDSSKEVTRDEFHQFAQTLSLGERYPGITNISFSFRVPHARKLQFERAVRAERSPLVKGLPEFTVKPPGDRPEYAVLTYLEPMGKNVVAWGLDLNADPLRRSAMDRARDTGEIASSSGVTLLRDSNASVTSTILRLAAYRGGDVPASVEERRRLYWGMVGSTVRLSEMIDAALSKGVLARAQLQIYEVVGESGARDTLLFDSAAPGAAAAAGAPSEFSGYGVTRRLAVGDREWRLWIVPRKDPVDLLDKAGVAAILAALLAISALVFWLMTSIAISESRGAELAQRNREAALLRERLREQAMRDKLTGLYNRHYVEEWFGLELRRAQRHGWSIAAIMLDIDHFKRFNDTFGHEAGDLVLRELAGALGRTTRGSDVASRYGGEEFLVLLPECPFDAALRRAERMREEVAKLELRYGDRPLGPVTVSLGVAVFPDHTKESEELLRCADEALYAAKQAGRNRVVAYSADPQKAGTRQGA